MLIIAALNMNKSHVSVETAEDDTVNIDNVRSLVDYVVSKTGAAEYHIENVMVVDVIGGKAHVIRGYSRNDQPHYQFTR